MAAGGGGGRGRGREGVSVCKLQSLTGDKRAAAESLSDGGEDESPLFSLPGTYTHRFIPRATFTFLHLLPIPPRFSKKQGLCPEKAKQDIIFYSQREARKPRNS